MDVEQELGIAKIDHLVMGLDRPASLPKLFTEEGFPEDDGSVCFHNNAFYYYSKITGNWVVEPSRKLYIYAGTYTEAEDWCRFNNLSLRSAKITYISSELILRGAKNYYYVKYGTWRDRGKEERILIEHYLTNQLRNMGNTPPIQLSANDSHEELVRLRRQQQQHIEERKANGY